YVPNVVNGIPIIGGAFSYICFDLAVKSLNFANAAIKSAFIKIDGDALKLELMQGSNKVFSKAILDELEETEGKIFSKDKKSEFARKIHEASKTIAKLQLEYPNNPGWGIFSKLIGKEGVLEETQVFHQRIVSSIETLESIHLEESDKYPEMLFDAKEQIKRISEAKIPQIKRLELNGLGIWEGGIARFELPEYGKYDEMEAKLGKAKLLHTDSLKVLAKKDRGYLASSYLKLQSANKNLGFVLDEAKTILEGTAGLEEALQISLENLQNKVEGMLQKKAYEPFIHTYLDTKITEFKTRRANFPYGSQIGSRVNEFVLEIGILEKILKEADASDILVLKRTEILAEIGEFEISIKRAKTDGIDVTEEELLLSQIKNSLESYGLDTDLAIFNEIEKNLIKIKESLNDAAKSRYSSLNGRYLELSKDSELLQLLDRITFGGYEKYFDGGEIDFIKSLGSLAGMEKFLNKKLEETSDKKNTIAKETLQRSIIIREIVENSALDIPTKVTAYIDIENPLGFDVEEARLRLDLPISAMLANASDNIRLEKENEALFIVIKHPLKHNLAVLEYQIIANTLLDLSEKLTANLNELKLIKIIRFKTSKSSALKIELDAISENYFIEYRGIASGRIENGKLVVALAATLGENEIQVGFIAKKPFKEKIDLVPDGNSQVLVDAKYLNEMADLPYAQISLHRLTDCEISKVIVDRSDFEFDDYSKGKYLELELSSKNWAKGIEKGINARLICNNAIANIVSTKIGETNAQNTISENLQIENARQLFSQGRYLEALELAQKADLDDGKKAELENKLQILGKTSKILLENTETEEFGKKMQEEISKFQNTMATGNYKESQLIANDIEGEIEKMIEGRITIAKQECKNLCSQEDMGFLDNAITAQISKNYFQALISLNGLKGRTDRQKIEKKIALDAKSDSLEGAPKLALESTDAIYEFELFFEIPQEMKTDRQRDENYKKGFLAMGTLKKSLLELENIDNAMKTGMDAKYSKELIDSKIKRGKELLLELQTSSANVQELATLEIEEMEKRFTQFGKAMDEPDVQNAKGEFGKRHFFAAWVYSKKLNYVLVPKSAQGGIDLMPIALPAIALLAGISYFALFRKKN
ncbi:MAG: hypothetical protein AABY04_02800, partial [Candidatus Micrarchaeota archaeon]